MTNESSLDALSIDDLVQRRHAVEARLEETTARITGIVLKDIPRYLEREARRRWLSHADFAAAMGDAELEALKGDLRALADALTASVGAELGAADTWRTDAQPASARTLEDCRPVWVALQQVACSLSEVLSRHSFPHDEEAPEGIDYALIYKTPVYFIDGEYCPSMVETYWGLVAEHQALSGALTARQAAEQRQRLEARWGAF